MPTRRLLLASAVPAILSAQAFAAPPDGFRSFVAEIKAEARKAGIRPATLDRAFAGVSPNQKVLDRDRHQPEFTMTWARYRGLVITDKRITDGRQAVAANRALFQRVEQRYGVGAGVIAGIWGLESSFGTGTGDFRVVEALATLAWEGRRASFFRGELMAALKILDHGDVAPAAMTGSYAGAMGQPQFMPSVYLSTAVSFSGNGRPDIWTSDADTLASMGNYLAKAGWTPGQPSSEPVLAPSSINVAMTGRENVKTLGYWLGQRVQRLPGAARLPNSTPAALLLPDGAGGEAFLVYANFQVIRRYNASDYYALAVGGLGRMVLSA